MTSFYERLEAALAPAYKIEREIPGGGMSHVYLATEEALGRSVVVKVLPPDLAAGVNRDRFRREIQLAAQLQHPHIVPLLAAGEFDDLLYYTMPYVSGESLRTRLAEQGRIPIRDVIRILTDVVDALAYAHAHGVIHRDIKPANVLTQRSHALVTDFGVAKALSAALPAAGATTSGFAIGTPAYMAPEQLAADPAADHRVDLYAVGLLAYELLSGESPFSGPSPAALMAAQLTRDPAPVETLRPDVPPALSAIVRRCLSKDPDNRPASAEALLAELEEIPRDAFTPTRPVAVTRPGLGRRRRVYAVGGAAVAVAALAVVFGRPAEPPSRRAAEPPTTTATAPGSAVLTRADSLAIADAVRRQLAQERARGGAPTRILNADSLARAFSRIRIDSLMAINQYNVDERLSRLPELEGRVWVAQPPAAAPRAPRAPSAPRRVAVIASSDDGRLRETEQAVVDSLARALAAAGFRPMSGTSLGVPGNAADDLVVTVRMVPIGRDSMRPRVDLIDPFAAPAYVHREVTGRTVADADALRGIGGLVSSAVTTLRQMARSPRSGANANMIIVPHPSDGRND